MRTNSICAAVYFALGIVLSYVTLKAYLWGSVVALLFFLLLLPIVRLPLRENTNLDAQSWTAVSTKGCVAFAAMIVSWLPQIWLADFVTSVASSFYFAVAGVILGVSLYFNDYLRPIKGYSEYDVELRALEMEHREVLAVLTFSGTAMLIVFGAVFGGYVLTYLRSAQSDAYAVRGLANQVVMGLYAAVGYILWILRPLHARAREIRMALKTGQ